jgi:hypothetical protein
MPPACALSFTAAHRMVNRVFSYAAVMRPNILPSVSSGFTDFNI